MREVRSSWYECVVRYDGTDEAGNDRKVTESHVVEAHSFTDAEARILSEISSFVRGGLEVRNITPLPFKEVFFSEDGSDDKWYKCKLVFITLDERTGKEKRSAATYLVQAGTLKRALQYVEGVMSGTMIDYVASTISETRIVEVYES